LVANWVSFGFFHDAQKHLRPGTRLAQDIQFCVDAKVDTLDARAADEATLAELKDMVDRVVMDARAAGSSGFQHPGAYPGYMEKLAALQVEVAAALADCLYCKIFVDSSLDGDGLVRWISGTLGGVVERRTVSTASVEIYVDENDEYEPRDTHGRDQFLYFRYALDVEAVVGAQRPAVIAIVSQLLHSLWASNMPAVAACDYEDELPRRGGYERPDDR
jgi:hypothetical protein